MFPRYFPYGQPSNLSNLNPILGLNLGVPVDSASLASNQDISSLLLSAPSVLPVASSFQTTTPYLLNQALQSLNSLNATAYVHPLLNQFNLSQLLPLVNSTTLQQTLAGTQTTSSEPSDAHTIVRAPVLYGNNGSSGSQTTATSAAASKTVSNSPPDQIVASYAAAAHAAAIVCHQPLSNAAEVFLSAAASAASSLASSTGQAVTKPKNRVSQWRTTDVLPSSTVAAAPSKAEIVAKPPLPWNSTWNRIVDRQTGVVVYISPGGARLKSFAEVREHLERWLPAQRAAAISDECIHKSFCFDATREVRLVAAPDDSIFVFPEDGETLSTITACHDATVDGKGVVVPDHPAETAAGVSHSPPRLPTASQTNAILSSSSPTPLAELSNGESALNTIFAVDNGVSLGFNLSAGADHGVLVIENTKPGLEATSKAAPSVDNLVSIEKSTAATGQDVQEDIAATAATGEVETDGSILTGLEDPKVESETGVPAETTAEQEDGPSQAKMAKHEPENTASGVSCLTSLPQLGVPSLTFSSLSGGICEAAQTTPSFVARGMVRSLGGTTAVVPSVVPSVLPPTTSTPAVNNLFALVQHFAALQQQQAFLAAAAASSYLHQHTSVVETAQHQQLMEHFKQQQQQQALAAAQSALYLQQHQQNQLQLMQAVYASALQQQSKQNGTGGL